MAVIKKIKSIISSFSKEERLEFKKFFMSEYSSEATYDIYDFIVKKIGKEDNFLKIRILEKHSKRNYHYATNSIVKLLERYLVLNSFKHKSAEFNIRLLEEYNNRGLIDIFDTQAKKVEKILSNNNKFSAKRDYLNSYLNSEIQISIPHSRNTKHVIPLRDDSHLKYLYIIAKLESFIKFFTDNAIIYGDITYQDIIEFIEVNKNLILGSNLASIYSGLIGSVSENELDINYCFSLLQRDDLQEDVKYRIFSLVITYTLVSTVDTPKEILYDFILVFLHNQEGNIFFNGKVDSIYFFVVFRYVLHFQGYIAAKRFIEANKTGLSNNMRGKIVQFCELIIFYKNESYGEVIKHINITKFTHPYLNIMYRVLKLKIYYDLELKLKYDKTIDNYKHISTTKRYLEVNRDNINVNILSSILNFITFYEIIYLFTYDGIDYLKRRISAEETIEKEWLLSKLEKL